MTAEWRGGQSGLLSQPYRLHQFDHAADIPFDGVEADQFAEFGEQVFEGFRLGFGFALLPQFRFGGGGGVARGARGAGLEGGRGPGRGRRAGPVGQRREYGRAHADGRAVLEDRLGPVGEADVLPAVEDAAAAEAHFGALADVQRGEGGAGEVAVVEGAAHQVADQDGVLAAAVDAHPADFGRGSPAQHQAAPGGA